MTTMEINFKWKRSESIEYPKVWHTFKARDLDSNDLVEYRIEDITKSNANEVLKHLKANYILDDVLIQAIGKINKFLKIRIYIYFF